MNLTYAKDTFARPEKTRLDIGLVTLNDCAPLVIAHEKGFFEAEGLDVRLHPEQAWASIRDKILFDIYDAAQMLYPMPLAMSLGVASPVEPTTTAVCLGLNGNAITVNNALFEEMDSLRPGFAQTRPTTADALRAVIARRGEDRPLTMGVVFPTSTHHYELRDWMAAAGIDPDQDVRLIVLPPPQMPAALRRGWIDGYCVGEPWNSFAISRGWGRALITKQELWPNAPEKVLGVTRRWAQRHPNTHRALVRAVIGACGWCDQPENRPEVASIIASPRYVNAPLEVVEMSMCGTFGYAQTQPPEPMPDFHVFHRYAANFPWRTHVRWHLSQMIRWGQVDGSIDAEAISAGVVMPEVYRQAAAELGVAAPLIDTFEANTHPQPWTLTQATEPIVMGRDVRFDHGRPKSGASSHPATTSP